MEPRYWRDYNYPLLCCVLILLTISLVAVYSATLNAVTGLGTPLRTIFPSHVITMGLGLVAMAAVTVIDYRLLSSLARPLYLVTIAVLAVVLLIGQVSGGAQSWIALGTRTFQPSEIAKIALIIALAAYWQRFEERRDDWRVQLGSLIIVGVPMGLIFLQPDLGTAMVFATIWLCMAWAGGLTWQQFVLLALLAIPVLYFGWREVLDEEQKSRLSTFYWLLSDPSRVDPDEGYNVIQALKAIGAGGLFGTGLTKGLLSQGNYIPVQHSDFIFAVIGEEMGFLGSLVLITFLALLLWMTLGVAGRASDLFGRLIAVGVFAMILAHVLINIGMNLSLLPVTGLPLPLISHGGSFMITVLAAIGLLQSVAMRRRRLSF
jgi:rod shape determining protein RodA